MAEFWMDPFEEMVRMRRAMSEMMKEFFTREGLRKIKEKVRTPLLDIRDEKNEIVAVVELPGLSKEDIKIRVEPDTLTIKAEKKVGKEEKGKKFYRYERSYTGFYRRATLPEEVIPEKVKAKYENGILEIRMKKAKPVKKKPGKEIKVE